MWWAFAIIAAIILLTLAFMPVRAAAEFVKSGTHSGAKVTLKLAFVKIKLYPGEEKPKKKSKPVSKPEEKKSDGIQITEVLKLYKAYSADIRALLDYISRNAVKIEKIRLNIAYGAGDAAQTGILYGVISGAVYGLLSILCNRAESKLPEVTIAPDFNASRFEAEGECITKLKNVHIIVIAVKACKLFWKIKKGK